MWLRTQEWCNLVDVNLEPREEEHSLQLTDQTTLSSQRKASGSGEASTEGQTFIISARHVSKKYKIYRSGRDRLLELLTFQRRKCHTDFWALCDVSFDLPRGHTLGLIGRNGSGKSTLLHILAGVRAPTQGEVKRSGKIAALLELGAGFNPEFSGRENAELAVALSGDQPSDLQATIEEIRQFAAIGDFFEQPVKTYSSGMFVRLAFAAAINCSPDILIVDEALAVGDTAFQNKCYRRINELRSSGCTILLVSHDHEAIRQHCDRAILLEQGKVIEDGAPTSVIVTYLDLIEGRQGRCGGSPGERAQAVIPEDGCFEIRGSYNVEEEYQRSDRAEIVDYYLLSNGIEYPSLIESGDVVDLYITVRFHADVSRPAYGIALRSRANIMIYAFNTAKSDRLPMAVSSDNKVIIKFSLSLPLAAGEYFFDIGVDEMYDGKNDYQNICRRNSCIKLSVTSKKEIFGMVDLSADVKFFTNEEIF